MKIFAINFVAGVVSGIAPATIATRSSLVRVYAAILAGGAFALYPTLLPASTGAANNITVFHAAAGRESLALGLVWWSVGVLIAIGYFVFVYRLFAGKVRTTDYGH